MRILHRHLLLEMLAAIGVAVLVCTGLLLLGNLLKEILALLMTGQASLWLVVRAIGLLIPFVLTFALPMGALTAALLVFGRFSADQELTAARANGISLVALALPVVVLSLGLCGICGWVNLELAPRCRVAYKDLFREIAREQARTLIPAGRFVTEYPGFVIYADRVRGNDLEDVLFFQMKDGKRVRDLRAPKATVEFAEERREIRLTFFDARILEWIPRKPMPPPASEPPADPREPAGGTPEPEHRREGTGPAVLGPVAEGRDAGRGDDWALTEDPVFVVTSPAWPGPLVLGTPGDAAQALDAALSGGQAGTNSVTPRTKPEPEVVRDAEGAGASASGWWLSIASGDAQASVNLPAEVVRGGLPALSDMTWRQLWSERRELLRLGVDDLTPLEVQLHRQAAFSFATFGFVLIGIPLGVRAHRRETSVGVAVAIGLVLVYYAFLVVAQALETQAESAPWIIVWLPNVLFQLAGGWMLWRVNRGR